MNISFLGMRSVYHDVANAYSTIVCANRTCFILNPIAIRDTCTCRFQIIVAYTKILMSCALKLVNN